MFRYLVLAIVVIVPLRGWIIWLFGIQPNTVYELTAISFIGVSTICLILTESKNIHYYIRKLLFMIRVNSVWWITTLLFTFLFGSIDRISGIYQIVGLACAIPLMRLPHNKLITAASIVALGVSISVIYFHFLIASSPDPLNMAMDIGLTFRERIDGNLHAAGSYLTGGILGSNHDAGNILALLSILFLCQALYKNNKYRYYYFTLSGICIYALLLTGSTTNFLAVVFSALLILILLYSFLSLTVFAIGFFGILLLQNSYFYITKEFPVLSFLQKIQSQIKLFQSGEIFHIGILQGLSFQNIIDSLHGIITGFSLSLLHDPIMHTEIAYIKIIFEYGLILSLMIFFVLFFPLYLATLTYRTVMKNNIKYPHPRRKELINIILSTMPVITSMITLAHYGSLLRITSLAIYVIVFTISIRNIIGIREKFLILR
jgi:hypothetical protein